MFHGSRARGLQLEQMPSTGNKLGRLAEKGRIAELRDALATAPDGAVNLRDANGFTPLLHACAEGHVEVVRLLLDHGAATDIANFDGETPLHLASSIGYDSCAEALVAAGADVTVQTSAGKSALDLAQQMGHAGVLAILEGAAPAGSSAEDRAQKNARAAPTPAPDARDLAFSLLESDLSELHESSLEEVLTILGMVQQRIADERAARAKPLSI